MYGNVRAGVEVYQQSRDARLTKNPRLQQIQRASAAYRKSPAVIGMALAAKRIERTLDFEEQHGAVRQLVVDGRWNTPIEQRPKGWERMGISE